MEYTRLGNSGLKVSKVILGAMSYGDPKWAAWVKSEEESLPLLKAAFDLGINTWDTADVYSDGASERIIAKAIEQYKIPRSKLVILSKCYFGLNEDEDAPPAAGMVGKDPWNQQWVNRTGLSRKHIFDAVDASVERLGTYIDVLQIHRLDRDVPMEEIMRALHEVVLSGKVRYIGASSMAAWEFQMLQNIAEKNGWTKFISMQNYYNLIYREEEREMIPYCKATGVGIIPWSPLARGALARPWSSRSTTREQTDGYMKLLIRSREHESEEWTVKAVEEVAKKHGVSMAMVATAWTLAKGVNPILGLNSVDRIEEAVKSLQVKLDEEDIKKLEGDYVPKSVRGH
ncbi:NADP-dependent oxidoreductase domain-containing protein [Tuber borchii]|uniref:NADP-dependent oxidoreductase domain-containing protein n=1 Tax=Tuber borchii TaxID=42251 RepID=A0A2T6ZDM5_TUBBO|nr:NADP-dependent oxidoreductase domain-containing protein [Tuber borchii]